MRITTLLLCTAISLAARAVEPTLFFHDSLGMVSDTILTFPTNPNAATVALETRYAHPARKSSAVALTWQDGAWSARINIDNRHTDDMLDRRAGALIVSRAGGSDTIIEIRDADIHAKGECSFVLELTQYCATLLAGNITLKPIAQIAGGFDPTLPVAIDVHGSAEIIVAVLETIEDPRKRLATAYNPDSLATACLNAEAPQGVWKYLDRDTDSRMALAGGRYTLAIVKQEDSDGYDIIYLDGAETHADSWQPGMKKGELKPTIFSGHYDLIWYDAAMEPITLDAHASIEQGAILTLSFPLLKSTLRFSKSR